MDGLASMPQYLRHLLPVWRALPEVSRGTLHVTGDALAAVPTDVAVSTVRPPWRSPNPILVASYADLLVSRPRPAILMEHGAGQQYRGEPEEDAHPSYAGGRDRETVVLFLCPNEAVAAANRAAYPHAAVAVVGSPYLDWLRAEVDGHDRTGVPTVVATWHFECRATAPEARSAREFWWPAIPAFVAGVREHGVDVVGHGHPKDGQAQERWRSVGVEFEASLPAAMALADVVMADNTSVLFEAAALDTPVVVLDAPWYRPGVEHGTRFWEWADIGPRPPCTPASAHELAVRLAGAVTDALDDHWDDRRAAMVAAVYDDRQASRPAQRAAAAILGAIDTGAR